jgi:hypothetical protein
VEQVRVKVVEMCTTYTAEELYTKEFSKLNDLIFSHLKEMQERKKIATESEAELLTIHTKSEADRKKIEAENEALIIEIRTKAEVESIKNLAHANTLKYTPEYIQLEAIKAWSSIDKVYYGNSIPNIIMNPLGQNVTRVLN